MQGDRRRARAAVSGLTTLLAVAIVATLNGGCHDANDPTYWLGKMSEPSWREQAMTNLGRIYRDKVRENGNNPWAPPVREYVTTVGSELIGMYPGLTLGGSEDVAARDKIVDLLAEMDATDARSLFESAVADIEGTKIDRANSAADALARYCRSHEVNGEYLPLPEKRDESWRQRCTAARESVGPLLAVIGVVKNRRAERGSLAENTAEEDQLSRTVVSALGNILLGNPDHPQRTEIVRTLLDILETPDTVQDLAVNNQALNMLGEIGDTQAVPTLVRMLFYQGQRRKVALQEVVRPAMMQMDDLDAMAAALVKAGRMQDEALNAMQQADSEFDARLIKEQIALTLGMLGIATPTVTEYLTEELNITEPSDFDRLPARGETSFTPETSVAFRRGFAAGALGKLRHMPAFDTIAARLRLKKVNNEYLPVDADVDMVELPAYMDAAGDYLLPEKTNELFVPFVLYGDDALIDRAGRRLYLQADADMAAQLEERAQKLSPCEEGFEGKCPHDNFMKIYVANLKASADCTTVECWAGRLGEKSTSARIRAAHQLARLGVADEAAGSAARTALLANINENTAGEVLNAYIFAIDRVSPRGCDPACIAGIENRVSAMRGQANLNAQRRDLTRLLGVLTYRARSGG
jgi:hypothetical protein